MTWVCGSLMYNLKWYDPKFNTVIVLFVFQQGASNAEKFDYVSITVVKGVRYGKYVSKLNVQTNGLNSATNDYFHYFLTNR